MRYLIMLLFIAFLSAATATAQDKGIHFEKGLTWEQLKSKAQAAHKMIFVDFYTTWCGPCRAMDADVYSDESVADFFNRQFISVKVQMDSTAKDDEQTRSWYSTVKYFQDTFQIFAFPSFMFFSPDGSPLHRSLGFKSPKELITLGLEASDQEKQYYIILKNYRSGKKDYTTMGTLASQARTFGDRQLSEQIAQDYKENYINKLSPEQLRDRKNIDFMTGHLNLISSADYFFQLTYKYPLFLDSIYKGLADIVIKNVIEREEINPFIKKDGRFLKKEADWSSIKNNISRKYDKSQAQKLVLEARLAFYKRSGMWKQFVKWRDKKLALYPPEPTGGPGGDLTALNSDAWAVFISCNDQNALKRALAWSELVVTTGAKIDIITSCMDTKANLLYKLGRRQEAVSYESQAVAIEEKANKSPLPEDNSILRNYRKMLDGKPTWEDR